MGATMRRGEAMKWLGIGRRKFQSFIDAGVLTEIHVRRDRRGQAVDYAMFCREQVQKLADPQGK